MKLQANQWPALTQERINVVEDLVEIEDNVINNVVQNLIRWAQDIFHAEILGAEVVAVAAAPIISKVLHVLAVLPQPRIDARTKNQVPYVLSAFSLKKIKMAGQLVRHYAGIERALTKENMAYVIL